MTMQVIQHIELGSAAANITFSSIPQTFTDLLLVVSTRSANTGDPLTQLNIQFNGSGGTAYSDRNLIGTGSSAGSGARTGQSVMRITTTPTSQLTANTFGNAQIYIPNYAGSTVKSVSMDGGAENNGTLTELGIVAALWNNTAAITQIAMTNQDTTNFVSGSSATLYGITKGSDGITTVS